MRVMSLRIGTWNILGRQVYGTGSTAEPGAVRSVLAENHVDILCLQEIQFYDGEADQQLVTELHEAGLNHFVGHVLSDSHLDKSARLGVGIASRYPLSRRDDFVLTRPDLAASVRGETWVLHDKGMVGCMLDSGDDRDILIYSLHLFPFFEFGVREDDRYVDRMWREFWSYADEQGERGRLVLAGDFNQQRRKDAAERWSRKRWRFCFDEVKTTLNGLALDEIALSWSPPEPRTTLIPTFSDHHLAIAEVQLWPSTAAEHARSGEARGVAVG